MVLTNTEHIKLIYSCPLFIQMSFVGTASRQRRLLKYLTKIDNFIDRVYNRCHGICLLKDIEGGIMLRKLLRNRTGFSITPTEICRAANVPRITARRDLQRMEEFFNYVYYSIIPNRKLM